MDLCLEHEDFVLELVFLLLDLFEGFLEFLFGFYLLSVLDFQLINLFPHRKYTILIRLINL